MPSGVYKRGSFRKHRQSGAADEHQEQPTPTPARRPPPELDINLDNMRTHVTSGLFDSLREGLQMLNDLDAMGRVLNAHAQGAFTPKLSLNGHNGNGTARVLASSTVESPHKPEPKLLTEGRRPKRSARASMAAIRDVAKDLLKGLPAGTGIGLWDIAHEAKKRGAIPQSHRVSQAVGTTRQAMYHMEKSKAVRRISPTKEQVAKGIRVQYVAGEAPPEGSAPDEPDTPPLDTPTTSASTTHRKMLDIPMDMSVNDAVLTVMLQKPAGTKLTPKEITTVLLDHGWPVLRHKNKLINHVNWGLRSMAEHGRVNRYETQGVKNKPSYSVIRPNVKVTKH